MQKLAERENDEIFPPKSALFKHIFCIFFMRLEISHCLGSATGGGSAPWQP